MTVPPAPAAPGSIRSTATRSRPPQVAGMLVSDDGGELVEKARWSTQSREPFPGTNMRIIGYNYRPSNILAALGRAQLARLPR